MSILRSSRRSFLGTLGVSIGAAPFLRPFSALAGQESAKKLVIFFTPNGTIRNGWLPAGSESSYSLGTILAPLEAHEDRLLVLDGVDMKTAVEGFGDGHQRGFAQMLTATPLPPGPYDGAMGFDSIGWAQGISVDQAIADVVGTETPYRSLEFGVRPGDFHTPSTRMCYRGADTPLVPEKDPRRAWDQLFGGLAEDEDVVARRTALTGSVLDHVNAEIGRLRVRIDAANRPRLDRHLDAIREIEQRLASGVLACEPPKQPGLLSELDADLPEITRRQIDVLVTALACGITRVASLQWTQSVGNVTFPWLDIPDRHHDLSHEPNSNLVAQDKLVRINTWFAEQFRYLLDRLAETPDGEGSLLDNTLVVWTGDLGVGNAHSYTNIPYVLAGGSWSLRTGRFVRFTHASHADLLLSILRVFGIERTSFGDPDYSSGPLEALF